MRGLLSVSRLLTAGFAFAAIAWAGCLGAVHLQGRASVLDRIESITVDLRFLAAGERPAPTEIVIVEMDDETVADAARWPSPRDQLAAIVRGIASHRPKALALDVLLLDRGSADAALADAIRTAPTILAAAGRFEDDARSSSVEPATSLALAPEPRSVAWPAQPFLDAAATGLANLSTDHGGTPRHAPLLFRSGDHVLPSFALAAAQIATGERLTFAPDSVRLGTQAQPLDLGFHLPLRFYGPRRTIPTISAISVLRSEPAAAALAGRIVVLGATAVGSGDRFSTPFDPSLSGVEVFATAISNIITGDGLVRTKAVRELDAVVAVLLAAAAVLLIAMRRTGFGLTMIGLLTAGWGATTVIAFMNGYWLSVAVPLAAILPTALLHSAAQLWLDRRFARHLLASQSRFRRFHSPILGQKLADEPDFLAEPALIDAAVVFLDLSGYTQLSERQGPEATRHFLKTFHAIVERETDRRSGLVISFMGDGAMLLFGFPYPKPDDARRAIEAVFALDERLTTWLSSLAHGPMHARFGAHFGPVVMSRLGGDTHEHITATGDTVNVASRLMEVAKSNEVRLAASERLCEAAGENEDRLTPAMEVSIRGRAQPLRVRLERR